MFIPNSQPTFPINNLHLSPHQRHWLPQSHRRPQLKSSHYKPSQLLARSAWLIFRNPSITTRSSRPPPSLTKTNKSSHTAPTPWIITEILSLKSARRCLERIYIASHSIFDLKLLRSATNRYHKFIDAAKKSFYASLVQCSSSKPRALWKTINNIVHRTANRSLPTSSPLAALPQLFSTYFSDKISKLHFNLQINPSFTPAHFQCNIVNYPLNS